MDAYAAAEAYFSEEGLAIERENYIKRCMKEDKEEALRKISEYMDLDLTYGKLILLSRILSYSVNHGFEDSEKLVDDMGLSEKHLTALIDNYTGYEKEITYEEESRISERERSYQEDREYFRECYGY